MGVWILEAEGAQIVGGEVGVIGDALPRVGPLRQAAGALLEFGEVFARAVVGAALPVLKAHVLELGLREHVQVCATVLEVEELFFVVEDLAGVDVAEAVRGFLGGGPDVATLLADGSARFGEEGDGSGSEERAAVIISSIIVCVRFFTSITTNLIEGCGTGHFLLLNRFFFCWW